MYKSYKYHNPAENDLAIRPGDYIYSLARDYSGEKSLFDIVIDLGCFSDTTRKIRAAAGQKVWDTRNVKPGTYIYTLKVASFNKTGKIVLTK